MKIETKNKIAQEGLLLLTLIVFSWGLYTVSLFYPPIPQPIRTELNQQKQTINPLKEIRLIGKDVNKIYSLAQLEHVYIWRYRIRKASIGILPIVYILRFCAAIIKNKRTGRINNVT